MNIEKILHPSCSPEGVESIYKYHFAGKNTLCAKLKNRRIKAVKSGDSFVFLLQSFHREYGAITLHAIKLSAEASDAMQMLKNKLKEKVQE